MVFSKVNSKYFLEYQISIPNIPANIMAKNNAKLL